jgi:hypothetical protein
MEQLNATPKTKAKRGPTQHDHTRGDVGDTQARFQA